MSGSRSAEQLPDVPPHERGARRAADEHHAVDLRDVRVAERVRARGARAVDHRLDECLELVAPEPRAEPVPLGQLDLGLDDLLGGERLADPLRRRDRTAQHGGRRLRARRREPLREQPPGDHPIEVVAAEVRVAAGREHLEDAVVEPEDRDVEGAAAEVVHREHALRALVEAVRDRRRGGLVEEPQHVEPRELARVLGRLALRVVEVRRHRDDAAAGRLAERLRGAPLQRAEDLRGDLERRHRPRAVGDHEPDHRAGLVEAVDAAVLRADVARAAAHEPLHGQDGVDRTLGGLPLRGRADLGRARRGVVDRGREERPALLHRQHLGPVPLVHVGDEAVGRAEVDPDRAGHGALSTPERPRRARAPRRPRCCRSTGRGRAGGRCR